MYAPPCLGCPVYVLPPAVAPCTYYAPPFLGQKVLGLRVLGLKILSNILALVTYHPGPIIY